jgi:hypothetical protein
VREKDSVGEKKGKERGETKREAWREREMHYKAARQIWKVVERNEKNCRNVF